MSFERNLKTNLAMRKKIKTSRLARILNKTKTEHTLGWKLISNVLQAIRFAYIPTYIVIVLLVWQ